MQHILNGHNNYILFTFRATELSVIKMHIIEITVSSLSYSNLYAEFSYTYFD